MPDLQNIGESGGPILQEMWHCDRCDSPCFTSGQSL
jgi:hypothetical protein